MKQIRYRKTLRAIQWHKNGDHPDDAVFRPYEDTGEIPKIPREGHVVRRFYNPWVRGIDLCPHCKQPYDKHGQLDGVKSTLPRGTTVCPGLWLVLDESNTVTQALSNKDFTTHYEIVGDI